MPGKPHALNAGVAAAAGDLIGLIDDDEEIAPDWFRVVWRHFNGHPELDFIGGKCLPLWGAPRPVWLGRHYVGVIGWVDPGPQQQVMDGRYQGMLMGGNAVIRRRALERAGPYSAELSRTGTSSARAAKTRTCTTACSRRVPAVYTSQSSSSSITYPQLASASDISAAGASGEAFR